MLTAHRTHIGDPMDAVSQEKMTFAIDGRMVGDLGQLIAETDLSASTLPAA